MCWALNLCLEWLAFNIENARTWVFTLCVLPDKEVVTCKEGSKRRGRSPGFQTIIPAKYVGHSFTISSLCQGFNKNCLQWRFWGEEEVICPPPPDGPWSWRGPYKTQRRRKKIDAKRERERAEKVKRLCAPIMPIRRVNLIINTAFEG